MLLGWGGWGRGGGREGEMGGGWGLRQSVLPVTHGTGSYSGSQNISLLLRSETADRQIEWGSWHLGSSSPVYHQQ